MTTYADLTALRFHGHVRSEFRGGVLRMTLTHVNTLNYCKPGKRCVHYAEVPGRFRLPLRIDVTAKIDVPALYIMPGEGHVNFGDRFGNRRLDDICEPRYKINLFDNRIPFNEFVDISLIYDLREMQILINGEERYYSRSEKYMKSKLFPGMNEAGFPLGISCDKRARLEIRSVSVTEYNAAAGIVHTVDPKAEKFIPPDEKPDFEGCLSALPDALGDSVRDIDGWLRGLRSVKFKRQIGKYGSKITYIAPAEGLSYAIHIKGDVLYHTLQWYILTQGKPETWARKADRMEDTLNHLARSDCDFARRIWNNFNECTGGYGPGCLARTTYGFMNDTIIACHGRLHFNMNPSEFDDVKRFITTLNEI